jgi:hypothetical protein
MIRLLRVLMAIGSAFVSDTGSQGTASLDALGGKWKSTLVPVKGEAPMIPPDMTIEEKGGTVTVAMGAKGSPVPAAAFDGGTFLMLKMSMGAGMATVIIRPAETGRVRVEYFVEYPSGSRSKNFYYSEVFARQK